MPVDANRAVISSGNRGTETVVAQSRARSPATGSGLRPLSEGHYSSSKFAGPDAGPGIPAGRTPAGRRTAGRRGGQPECKLQKLDHLPVIQVKLTQMP